MTEVNTLAGFSDFAVLTNILLVISTSLLLSTALAFVYRFTFRGLAFSRSHTQSIILSSMIASVIVMAVGDSLIRALAILAAMAIIRYRADIRYSRETLFLFASLSAGAACGAGAFHLAVIATAVFSLIILLLHFSPLGQNCYFDGRLRFNLPGESADRSRLEQTLQYYCQAFSLVTLCETASGARLEYTYHVKLRQGKTHQGLVAELKTLRTLANVDLITQVDGG